MIQNVTYRGLAAQLGLDPDGPSTDRDLLLLLDGLAFLEAVCGENGQPVVTVVPLR